MQGNCWLPDGTRTCCPALALEGTPVWTLPCPALSAAAAAFAAVAVTAAGMHAEARPRSAPAAECAAAAGVLPLLVLVVWAAMGDGERLCTLLVGAAAAVPARQAMTRPAAAAPQVPRSLLGLGRAQQHSCVVPEATKCLREAGATSFPVVLGTQIRSTATRLVSQSRRRPSQLSAQAAVCVLGGHTPPRAAWVCGLWVCGLPQLLHRLPSNQLLLQPHSHHTKPHCTAQTSGHHAGGLHECRS
jgi:hypothetical protein